MLPLVRLLHPNRADDVDVAALYRVAERPRSPWVLVNMISTVDGASAIAGKSGGLGGPADKKVFAAVRSLADVILVGAGTVRAENYGPDRRLAIVTASLDLEPDARVFTGDTPPTVLTSADANPARRAALSGVANIVDVNEGPRVDLRAALAHLEGVVVCEGGPSLNGQLVADDLIDESCVTVSPLLAGGDAGRIMHGDPVHAVRPMRLARVLVEGDMLLLRYLRA